MSKEQIIAQLNLDKLKRVAYHFAGAVAVGHDYNSSITFETAWKNWVEEGKINPWHMHPSCSKEVVKPEDIVESYDPQDIKMLLKEVIFMMRRNDLVYGTLYGRVCKLIEGQ